MSALIKSSEALDFHSLQGPDDDVPIIVELGPPSDDEVTRLRAELAALRARHEGCPADMEMAREQGFEAGRERALAETDASRVEALETLEAACNGAIEHFSRNLLSVEKLATLIAQTVLERMLFDQAQVRDFAAQAIAARVREIEQSSFVRLLVSPLEFPDVAELDQLAALCGLDLAVVQPAADLAPGQCRIDLTLGTLDVGLRQQWEKLNAQLTTALDTGTES